MLLQQGTLPHRPNLSPFSGAPNLCALWNSQAVSYQIPFILSSSLNVLSSPFSNWNLNAASIATLKLSFSSAPIESGPQSWRWYKSSPHSSLLFSDHISSVLSSISYQTMLSSTSGTFGLIYWKWDGIFVILLEDFIVSLDDPPTSGHSVL